MFQTILMKKYGKWEKRESLEFTYTEFAFHKNRYVCPAFKYAIWYCFTERDCLLSLLSQPRSCSLLEWPKEVVRLDYHRRSIIYANRHRKAKFHLLQSAQDSSVFLSALIAKCRHVVEAAKTYRWYIIFRLYFPHGRQLQQIFSPIRVHDPTQHRWSSFTRYWYVGIRYGYWLGLYWIHDFLVIFIRI
jgi:hypothetical protein